MRDRIRTAALQFKALTLTRLGRLAEAEAAAREGVLSQLRIYGRYSGQTVEGLGALTEVLNEQRRSGDAIKLASITVEIYERMGAERDSTTLAVARRTLADAYVGPGRWNEALKQFNEIEAALSSDPKTFRRLFANNLNWAMALFGSGRITEALAIARAAHAHKQQDLGAKHYESAEALGLLAAFQAASGDTGAALSGFRRAIPILLTRSRQSDDDSESKSTKGQRLGFVLESYIDLLAGIQGSKLERATGIDAAAEAFRIGDVARSRAVQEALVASGARAAAANPELADLLRREQDAQMQIAALFGRLASLLSLPPGQRDPKVVNSLRTRIDDLRGARAALAKEIEARFPEYADLVNPKPATVAKVQARLQPGEALIATYVAGRKTYVWAVPKTGRIAFSAAPLGKERIAGIVGELRRALEPNAKILGDIPAFDVRLSHQLYRSILAPVRGAWQDAKSLLVIPHGSLGQLPFSVLVTENLSLPPEGGALFSNYKNVPWLARSHAVTVLPSVTSLVSLRSLPTAPATRRAFLGFGDPYYSAQQAAEASRSNPVQSSTLQSRGTFNVRGLPISLRAAPETMSVSSADLSLLPRLPDTFDEVRSIALALNADLTRDVFTGRRASEGAVKSANLSGYKVVTFATHGLLPGDLDGLHQPALALSAPSVAGDTNNDGLLTMAEILGLRLDADWVVLSACNTGAGNGAGAEAFSGLGRAFFYAGTRAILLSNWPVETTSARLLTTDIFKRQADDPSLSRAEALRQSMLALIDGSGFVDRTTNKIVFAYAHPIFWAPFTSSATAAAG